MNNEENQERASLPVTDGVDTPELRDLLLDYKRAIALGVTNTAIGRLIYHLNAHVAAVAEKALEEGANTQCHRWEIFAKEMRETENELRQRAEKAEADFADAKRTMDAMTDEISIMEEVQVVAQQAPDFNRLSRYWIAADGGPYALYVRFDEVQALLAQPSQQEGGKDMPFGYLVDSCAGYDFYSTLEEATSVCDRDNEAERKYSETAGCECAEPKIPLAVVIWSPPSDKLQQASGVCQQCGDRPEEYAQRKRMKDRFAARPKTPATADFDLPYATLDDRQQASTAQAEPVKRKEPTFVPAGYENETEFLRQQLKDARTSIKAHQTVLRELNEAKCVPHELGYPMPATDAGNAYTNGWNDCRLTMLGELTDDPTNLPTIPAQATPESAQELPPLPEFSVDWSRDEKRRISDMMREYARAAIASQQVEPVAWMYQPITHPNNGWAVTLDARFAKAFGTPLTPLYRAAPPKPVDSSK